MVLFKRFPGFRLSLEDEAIVPTSARGNFSSLADDFAILDRELLPVFQKLDKTATIQQNRYRWMYIVLICGSSLVTILGITQLAFRATDVLGILGAIAAAVLAIATAVARTFTYHERYLNARLAAEKLRSEYFMFLGHYKPYENDQDRVLHLRRSVIESLQRGMQ